MKGQAILLMAALSLGQTQINPKVTPLGTQRAKAKKESDKADKEKKESAGLKEKPEDIVERAVTARGGRQALSAIRDSTSQGTVTFFTSSGRGSTVDVTVLRKGSTQVQRVLKHQGAEILQGADGVSTWESVNGLTAQVSGGPVRTFVESETVREAGRLFDASRKGSTVRDAGKKDRSQILEVEEVEAGKPSRKTRYFIDDGTSQVTRIEWDTADGRDLFGKAASSIESFVYSDFRPVQAGAPGIVTPFRIERFVDGMKVEETQLTTVRLNSDLKDNAFKH